jgi:hypothetical protein
MSKFIINDYLNTYLYLNNPMKITDEELIDKMLEIIQIDFPSINRQIDWYSYETIIGLIFGIPVMTSVKLEERTDELEECLSEWLRRRIKSLEKGNE